MLQFSRDPSVGRIAFADRYQFRMELAWRTLKGRPDMQKLRADYLAKLKVDGSEDVQTHNSGPWHGVKAGAAENLTTRFGRFFPTQSLLLEVVMLWPQGMDTGLQRKTLDSIAEERQTSGLFRRWKAFGMDLLASQGMALDLCSVDPACVRMGFAPAKDARRSERFERVGFVDEWLTTSVRNWMNRRLPARAEVTAERDEDLHGHEIRTVNAYAYASGLARLLGRKRYHQAAAWLCPADGRLYYAHVSSGEPLPQEGRPPLAGGRLSCCGDLRRVR
jgi:hypothetical protein